MPLVSKCFFLSGGTALSAMYLGHRRSEDLDIFTRNAAVDIGDTWSRLGVFLRSRGWRIDTTAAQSQGFASGMIGRAGRTGGLVKVDLVFDGFAYEEARSVVSLNGIPVIIDNFDNLVVGKFSAFLSRGDQKDILDVGAIFRDIFAAQGEVFFKSFLRLLLEETKQRDAMAEDLVGLRDIFCAAAERSPDKDIFSYVVKLVEKEISTMLEKEPGEAGDDLPRN